MKQAQNLGPETFDEFNRSTVALATSSNKCIATGSSLLLVVMPLLLAKIAVVTTSY